MGESFVTLDGSPSLNQTKASQGQIKGLARRTVFETGRIEGSEESRHGGELILI